ncbi:hypothetical protein BASA81_007292 [Batrachochytrium salamandrivorans]|nr:hypothetical protein BASA81_007292 [Batrachochytrium salamandrivorans]
MSTQPLLSGSSATGTSGPRAASAKTPVSVIPSEVSFTARVPGVTNDMSLPTEEASLLPALDRQTGQEKTCDVTLSAQVAVRGQKASEVAEATHEMQFAFNHLVNEFEAIGETMETARQLSKNRESQVELQVTSEFHEHMINAMNNKHVPPAQLKILRQESMLLVNDFSSADGLLTQGVDGYVRAVQRVLKTDLDNNVNVTFRNLQYVSRTPVLGTSEAGFPTIGTSLFNFFLAPFVFVGRTVNRCIGRLPLIEYRERIILDDLTGVIPPGRLTLVLGPPGCGKTTFLKAISGKLYQVGSNAALEGSLKFNGYDVSELKNLANWTSYVRQSDEHQALLTTRETLQFGFDCRKAARYTDDFLLERVRQTGGGEEAVERIKALKEIEVDVVLAVLGLSKCAETIIGNDVIKGVSGGEKRRVTLGEMLVTGAQIMCADEISTGLDSAATFDITKFLGSACHVLGQTVVVALLQPAPEVLNLFDDIIVMAEGRIIYHGAREHVKDYFEGLGFRIPPNKDLGDFIVELPTRNGIDFQISGHELNELGLPKPPMTPNEFASRWKESKMFQNEMHKLDASESTASHALNHDEMPQNSLWVQFKFVLHWSMLLRLRAKEQVIARAVANIVVGTFFGTLFFNLQLDDWWLKAMLFAMALMFLISTAFPAVQVTSSQKPIFFKHIEANFYSSFVFCLAQFVVCIPFIAFDVVFFASSMYFMCNLSRHVEQFAIFAGICTLFAICGNAMMNMFPYITPDQDTAVVVAALALIVQIIASGAISTESMIPLIFRWMLWINPFAYAYRALAINEYALSGDYEMFPCKFAIMGIKLLVPDKCSHYFLSVREVRDDVYWIWIAAVVQVIATMVFFGITWYALSFVRFEQKRVGAVAEIESGKGGGKSKKKATEDELREAENAHYLAVMSPRNVAAIAGTPMNSSSQIGEDEAMHQANLPFSPKTLVIRNLTYTIPINGEPIDFLQNVSFWALPGRMTALMGSSGAGKTTLMDVVAGRKTVGYAKGSIMVNGKPKIQSEFTKYTGYVEQFGCHANAATVEESLEFSAALRLPNSVSALERKDMVKSTLRILELDNIRHALAGALSMEQNKRLTLGVELVANPSIVFCDEPTSGLDARAAAVVMSVLLRVAKQGRTVVCTIHQPSTAVFNFFDDLLLLKRGGEVVYFGELGPNSKNLIQHLESIPGSKRFESGSNPATYMLDCIGAGTGADAQAEARRVKVDYARAYEISKLKARNDARLLADFPPIPGGFDEDPVVAAARKSEEPTFVRGFWYQLWHLLVRNFTTYYRAPEFSLNRICVVMLFTALFAGFYYDSKMANVADVEGRIVLIFFFSSMSSLYSLYTLVPFAMSRRALYYRERASFTYSVAAYNWAEGLVEIPYILIQIAFTVPLIYYLTSLPYDDWERPIYFASMIFMLLVLMTSLAFFMTSLFSDPLAAQLASIGVLLTLMVFCGIMVPRQDLPKPYVPMYYVSFFKYSSEGLLTTQFHGLDDTICIPAGKAVTTGVLKKLGVCTYDGSSSLKKISGIQIQAADFVLNDFAKDYSYDDRYFDMLILLVWVFVLRLLTYFITLYVNHNRR